MADKKNELRVVAENRKARFDYAIMETYEAGIELTGSEVKSVRGGDLQLKDSYIVFANDQAYLQNAHISVYRASSYNNHEPERRRRLLMHRLELDKLQRAIDERGYTCVPLRVYFKGSWAKVEVALAKGKNAGDKRTSIKNRESERELAQARRR